jgi:5-formyltetrahydrofolate cyclo-ligase
MLTAMSNKKSDLRRVVQEKLAGQSPDDLAGETRQIHDQLFGWDVFQTAKCVHTYVSALPGEVDTLAVIGRLLERGTEVQVPVVRDETTLAHVVLPSLDALRPATYNLLEPDEAQCTQANPERAQLIIVPGRVFDRAGYRIGSGRGYYDRFLAPLHVPTAALVYSGQLVDAVPAESHDVPVQYLITPQNIIESRS